MNDKRYLFRGFHPDENGDKIITVDGKKIKGEWKYWDEMGRLKYGSNFQYLSGGFVVETNIIPETVGQWVTTDKNGKDIFEGDLIRNRWYGIGEVRFGVFNFSACDEYCCDHYGFYAKADMSGRYIYDDDGYAIIPRESDDIELISNKWEDNE